MEYLLVGGLALVILFVVIVAVATSVSTIGAVVALEENEDN